MDSNENSEDGEESEYDNSNISSNNLEDINNIKNLGNDIDVFIISLKLLNKFKDMHITDSDKNIINYINEIGLPIHFNGIKLLSLYLYFHKICSSYYIIFSNISNEKINDIFISLLKTNYYILADNENIHYNYIYLAEKIFPKISISKKENNYIMKIPFIITNNDKNISNKSEKYIKINRLILELAFESKGRLDIYMKVHILKSLLLYLNNPKLSSYIQLFEKMELDLINLYQASLSNKLDEFKYEQIVNIFTEIENKEKWDEYLFNLKKLLSIYQNIKDENSIKILEKLFIQLLGHFNRKIRNFSLKMLNMIYDDTTWQDRGPFPENNICIKYTEENLDLEIFIIKDDYNPNSIILIVSKPNENNNINYQCISYLKPKEEKLGKNEVKLTFSLGITKKCGFYDWYLVKFSKGRFANIKILNQKNKKDLISGKGRFIVINKDIKNLSIHEVLCDLIESQTNKEKNNNNNKIGSFKNLENKLEYFNQNQNINCLYITGALERDNNIIYDENTGKVIDIGNIFSSPMAITSRSNISSLLGGDKSFISLINKAHDLSMKIILDSFDNISSVRFNRKYRNLLLRHLDKEGKINIYYGTDGKNIKYEDCLLLNYRKIEAWDLLISEINTLIEKYGIDGIHINNCQAWPNIMKVNLSEMFRIDLDGKKSYSSLDILNGEIIEPNTESGYWDCDEYDYYPNPFLVKLTKSIWKNFPGFIFLGECWINKNNYKSRRHINLIKSGIIPRMNFLSAILNEIYNNNSIERKSSKDNNLIENCYKEIYKDIPKGSIMLQSSFTKSFLSNINQKALISIINLLYFLPDIPITFMEEGNNLYNITYKYKNINNNIDIQTKGNSSLIRIKKEIEQEKNIKEINISNNNIYNLILKYYTLLFNSNKNKEIFLDIQKIENHFIALRKLRSKHESIKEGKLIFLKALNPNGNQLNELFTFARQSNNEICIFIINLKEEEKYFCLDLSSLFNKNIEVNTVIYIENKEKEKKGEYFLFGELNQVFLNKKIEGYQSKYFWLSITDFNEDNYQKALNNKKVNNNINMNTNNIFDDYQIINQLKEILNKQLPIEKFNKWASNLSLFLRNNNISLSNYINKIISNLEQNENLISIFSSYCHKSNEKISKKIINSNKLGLISFITPEIGRWSSIGGLGVMVDELTQGLSALGQEIIIISPYYYKNRKGFTNYLSQDDFNFKKIKTININLDTNYSLDVYHGKGNNIDYYFLFNEKIFPKPYPNFSPIDTVKEISCFAKGSLQLLYELNKSPDIFVTNDWFCGLAPAYGKNSFGNFFEKTIFFHIIHNLEPTYEGRIYLSNNEGSLENIYKFDPFWLIDPNWKERIINPSRCAIMMSDQWGTVSHSYKKDLLENSPLNFLLKKKPKPFSYPNGIYIEKRIKILEEFGYNKKECKKYIQKKYFLYKKEDISIPLYSFIGRITKQKGILLILESIEDLIKITDGKINILLGGKGDKNDPYVLTCIQKINNLRKKYPNQFWANPDIFFPEGTMVNLASDFALMPSLFEPGGIVQHEFFIAKTPVIAFRTGGLKDTVFEFNWKDNTGNGFIFENYNKNDFVEAIKRSLNLFKNKEKFEICKENAFKSAIDVAEVSKNWCKEFYRLKNKIFFEYYEEIKDNKILEYKDGYNDIKEKKELNNKLDYSIDNNSQLSKTKNGNVIQLSHNFYIKFKNKKPKSVLISGSFDSWKVKHPLIYDLSQNIWSISLNLKQGKYYYKYIIDGNWQINPNEKREKSEDGIINNYVII